MTQPYIELGFPCGSAGKESARNAGDLGQEDPLEKEMATHSSTLAWKIPWMGAWWAAVHGVTKSRTRLSDFPFTFHFSLLCIGEGNGKPLQCFFPGESQGRGSLMGCRLWGRTELDTTEVTQQQQQQTQCCNLYLFILFWGNNFIEIEFTYQTISHLKCAFE